MQVFAGYGENTRLSTQVFINQLANFSLENQ
jgi:hypothetical protein